MYSSLSIKSFRSIKSLEFSELRRINLLVGKNNVGKSTILEAVFLLCGINRPDALDSLGNARGQFVQPSDEVWRAFFARMSPEKPVEIKGTFNETDRRLTIEGLPPDGLSSVAPTSRTGAPEPITKLPVDFSIGRLDITQCANDGQEDKITIKRDLSGNLINTVMTPPNPKVTIIPSALIPSAALLIGPELVRQFSSLSEGKGQDDLIKSLQFIDPRICRVEVLSKGVLPTLHLDIGLDRLLPLAVTGAGTVHMFTIATNLAVCRDGVLLIDEIDNGLHHSVMPQLWEFLAEQCERFNVQVFATTHSDEMIRSALECLDDESRRPGLFRIDESKGSHKVVNYTYEAIRSVLESNFEVRS